MTKKIKENENISTKDRLYNFFEVILQCIKYKGFFTAIRVAYHYIVCRFFPKLIFSKTYSFLKFKIVFQDSNSIAHMFLELFGLNVYYFKSDTESPVIIDIGANIGDSVIYFKWIYPKSTIYAFEPLANAYSLLEQNVRINDFKNVFTYNVGLGHKEQTIKLFSDTKGTSKLSTINKNASNQNLKKNATVQEIKIKRLSSYREITDLKRIDLLKIDIEGAEGFLFEDLEPILVKTKKAIIEYHMVPDIKENSFDKIISHLKNFNFIPTFMGFYRNTDNEGNPIALLIIANKH